MQSCTLQATWADKETVPVLMKVHLKVRCIYSFEHPDWFMLTVWRGKHKIDSSIYFIYKWNGFRWELLVLGPEQGGNNFNLIEVKE